MNDYPKLTVDPGPLPDPAQALLAAQPAEGRAAAAMVWATQSPLTVMNDFSTALRKARRTGSPIEEAKAMARVKGAAIAGHARGLSEYQLSTALGVARNTVRDALGKPAPTRKKAR